MTGEGGAGLDRDMARLKAVPIFACLDEEQPDSLSVRWVEAGALLNEAALLAPGVQVDTATADVDSTVVTVSRTLMLRVLDVRPASAARMRRYWAAKLGARLVRFKASAPP